ncbi:5'-nucleotidase domain-containing protein 1 isoform X4 [Rattus norvegicus]|uniref:5'-nucleotidase domain-containing protein 1 isoform X4 n=1 Tax=Rattus norvegicus TaxID=10116 RepID=UPI0019177F11|nr:5'-nucleotidase domain-containing protein 1 isoform X4 [Rattus norvegicus]
MAQHFSLAACDVVGFDLDHTLCRYNLSESAALIYNSFAQFLVKEKGYDEELLTLTLEDWDFCCKGLALDLEDGTFIKLAADGTVLRASHGTKMMTPEALTEAYGKKEWRHCLSDKRSVSGSDIPCCSGKCYFYDNYFDLPGALLCAKVVDSLTKNRGQKTFDFWKDVVAGIQHNFKMSAFKGSLYWSSLAQRGHSQGCSPALGPSAGVRDPDSGPPACVISALLPVSSPKLSSYV